MITLPNGKICLNEQEAIQWLLDNYPVPFQCSADYAAGTEIGLGTIVNPTPAKVKVGSIIFFADSKVSTVVGLTANGFICSDQYNDLVDDVVYVSNVQLNASGHLIVTLSNGTNIDAGLIKQVSGFSINASQHLIVSFNDGSSTDLGAIFSGNITISGNLTVTGGVSGGAVTGDSIVENMTGYTYAKHPRLAQNGITLVYVGVVKNGNKITFAVAGTFDSSVTPVDPLGTYLGFFDIPAVIADKLIPMSSNILDAKKMTFVKDSEPQDQIQKDINCYKQSVTNIGFLVYNIGTGFDGTSIYTFRNEVTFLLSNNLAA